MQSSRRRFLKTGLAGALALAAGGAIYRAVRGPAPLGRFQLDGAARTVLTAVVPAMLAGAMPAEPAERAAVTAATVERVGAAVAALPLATQKEVQDLFGLMALGPARRWLAGVPGSWEEASPAALQDFLVSWRFHRLQLLQSAYLALHDLILGAWYADPARWAAIGYPGPIKELA